MEGNLEILVKAIEFKGYVVIACNITGLHAYRIENATLKHVQKVTKENDVGLIDIELDKEKKVIYALYKNRI